MKRAPGSGPAPVTLQWDYAKGPMVELWGVQFHKRVLQMKRASGSVPGFVSHPAPPSPSPSPSLNPLFPSSSLSPSLSLSPLLKQNSGIACTSAETRRSQHHHSFLAKTQTRPDTLQTSRASVSGPGLASPPFYGGGVVVLSSNRRAYLALTGRVKGNYLWKFPATPTDCKWEE